MNRMDPIVATCADPASAQRAIKALVSVGVKENEITVISAVPLDDWDSGDHEKASLMPWLVALGAILGGISGYLLVSLTQESYPIHTGGMPVVSLWPDGIITYELTMLGAILSTLLVLFWTAPLLCGKHPGNGIVEGEKIILEVVPAAAQLTERIKLVLQQCDPQPQARAPGPDIPGQSSV